MTYDLAAAEAIIDRAREELAALMGYSPVQWLPSLSGLLAKVTADVANESLDPNPDCEHCGGEGWVWDDEEGGSFDCVCSDAVTQPRDWRYFAEALAWYPGHNLTGAQTFGVVEQVRAALKDGRITPGDLGMVPVVPASASGMLDLSHRKVWQIHGDASTA